MTEHGIATTLMRGGTSKGVFIHAEDLPPEGPGRDRFILALMGSPDPMQIDGLGGTHSSTSKLMAVSASEAPDCDIDYLFAQAAIDEAVVDYQGNCGNLTTAIAPFAIDEGLVPSQAPRTTVVLRNLNTGVRIRADVAVGDDGRSEVEGDLAVAGVPGTGSPIVTDFLDPGGSVLGSALPTGSTCDHLQLADGSSIDVSIVDVTSPHVFVRGADVDLDDLDRLELIRSTGGAAVGLTSRAIPRLCIVDPAPDDQADIEGRATSMQRLHHAFPLTGALCTGAAARIPGTVVNRMMPAAAPQSEGESEGDTATVRLRHAKGVIEVRVHVDVDPSASQADCSVRSVGVVRTARRLLRGEAYVVLP